MLNQTKVHQIKQNRKKLYEAWQKPTHAEIFDGWSNLSLRALRKTYESFNEINLFINNQSLIKEPEFIEIGSATGELYRYMKAFIQDFNTTVLMFLKLQ